MTNGLGVCVKVCVKVAVEGDSQHLLRNVVAVCVCVLSVFATLRGQLHMTVWCHWLSYQHGTPRNKLEWDYIVDYLRDAIMVVMMSFRCLEGQCEVDLQMLF
jgi:hypothetical protein